MTEACQTRATRKGGRAFPRRPVAWTAVSVKFLEVAVAPAERVPPMVNPRRSAATGEALFGNGLWGTVTKPTPARVPVGEQGGGAP